MHTHIESETTGTSFIDRIVGVLKLDRPTYERIGTDPGAMGQAIAIVAAVAVVNGLTQTGEEGVGLFAGIAIGIVGWLVISGLTMLIGRMVADDARDLTFDRMLRLLGFAQLPMVFLLLSPLPVLGQLINLGASAWAIVTIVVAIQVAASVSIPKATFIFVAEAIALALVLFILVLLIAPLRGEGG